MESQLELLGERIAEQAAHLDAAMHRLLSDLHEFDRLGGWAAQGAVSCAHWLAWRVGWDLVTARVHVRVASKLPGFPAIDDALRRGQISYSQVRAIVRVATPANETMLLELARMTTAAQLEKLCRKYALALRHGQQPRPHDDGERRFVRRRDTEDGMVRIEAVLHPEEAELVWKTLDHAAAALRRTSQEAALADATGSREASGDEQFAGPAPQAVVENRTDEVVARRADDSAESRVVSEPTSGRGAGVLQRGVDAARRNFDRADALVSVAQAYLRGDRPARSPIEITVTIPAASLQTAPCCTDAAKPKLEMTDPVEVGEMGGVFIAPETARRLGCDAGVIAIIEDSGGAPISVGRKQRTIAGALKRALYQRDVCCTYPGCTHQVFLEGHHIKHWADGGETSLWNTVLLCSHHHRYVHEYGYTIQFDVDRKPQFRDPRGRLVTMTPARPAPPDLGWPHIRAANAPLEIDAATNADCWDGSPVDYGAIVGQLLTVDGLS